MIYLQNFTCTICGAVTHSVAASGTVFRTSVCSQCKEVENRKAYFKHLDELSLSARLRKLEEHIYDNK